MGLYNPGERRNEVPSMCAKKMLSIVVPVFNEEEQVKGLIDKITIELDKAPESHEIIVVDDGSTDRTWEVLKTCSMDCQSLRAIRLSKNFGKEHALRAGIEHARGDAVITLDGDLQHPPELIHELVEPWRNNDADIVEAIKRDRTIDGAGARLRAAIFYKVFSSLSGFELDGSTDYKLLDRKVITALTSMPERGVFYRGMASWLGFRVKKVPFDVERRISGETKWSLYKLIRYATSTVTSFTTIPLYLIGIMGAAFFLMSVIIGFKALYLWFVGGAIPGYTTLVFLVLISGSFIMLGLAIIGQYLAMIFKEIKRRPTYVIMEDINI